LVKAFKIVHNANPDLKLVFTGSDKGNENYIRELVSELGLDTKVLFLGFVSNLELKTLYKKAISLVMPTFLGPTNMPLLEARSLGCPIVCSDLDGHREQLGEGALYFDHRSYSDIASKMMEILDNGLRNNQIAVANEIEKTSVFNLGSAIESVNKNLMSVSKIRKIWGKNNRIF
jgi:glycosyltransferase involved in cell wall biosynthesis